MFENEKGANPEELLRDARLLPRLLFALKRYSPPSSRFHHPLDIE
jgi:hypothetical protein